MLKVERYINELMASNCYIVWDDVTLRCIVIDPASEHSLREIKFIEERNLMLDYIILTHEHTDHTWGVNSLLGKYDPTVICTDICKQHLPEAGDTYFRLYYEKENYTYTVRRVDNTVEELGWVLDWRGRIIKFVDTKGHSLSSMCIEIEDSLYTGDTLMQYKPYINKRNGSKELYEQSVKMLMQTYSGETRIYPGHGEMFLLKDR